MTDYLMDYIAAEAVRLPDGRIFRGPSCESKAARALMADGLPPDTRLVFCRGGQPSLRGGLATFAARVWAGKAADPDFRGWRPHRLQHAPSTVGVDAVRGVSAVSGNIAAGDLETALAERSPL
jgi:hypothetical protein